METPFDVVIVGGGPAGAAAALQLAQRHPEIAARTLLLDAADFPRDKVCGGGVVRQADRLLAHLGVRAEVPAVTVRRMHFAWEGDALEVGRPGLFRVVRRREFDAALLDAVKARGVTVREGVRVRRLDYDAEAVRVETARGVHRARVVIGADGARSRVRRDLVGPARGERFVALEALAREAEAPDLAADDALFDFRPAARGLRGYAWDFPCWHEGRRARNRGVGGSRWPTGTSLREVLAEALRRRGLAAGGLRLQGWNAPLYDPRSPQGGLRVVLAGDAVGVDPWLGEGISGAVGTGMLAAHAVAEALGGEGADRFDLRDHGERVARSAVGDQLLERLAMSDPFYAATMQPAPAPSPPSSSSAMRGLP